MHLMQSLWPLLWKEKFHEISRIQKIVNILSRMAQNVKLMMVLLFQGIDLKNKKIPSA